MLVPSFLEFLSSENVSLFNAFYCFTIKIFSKLTLISHLHLVLETFFKLGFTPCKAEQSPEGLELQEKEADKDQSIQETCLERMYG